MPEFITVTDADNGMPVLIFVRGISCVHAYDNYCSVTFYGREMYVTESYDEILNQLTGSDQK